MTDTAASTSGRIKRGGEFCSAVGCSNARYKFSCIGKPFFHFPKDEARCQQWIQNCRREDLKGLSMEEITKKRLRLCSDHFESNQFTVPAEMRRLNWNAIPTLFGNGSKAKPFRPRKRKAQSKASDLNFPSNSSLRRLVGKKRDLMKRAKERNKPRKEVKTVRRQRAVGESFSQSMWYVACLVCCKPFETSNNSMIPNLPFCRGCKNIHSFFTQGVNGSLSPQPPKCDNGGQCVIDYRYVGSKHWCSSCHVQKFQTILRRFDALQVHTGCNQFIEKTRPHPKRVPRNPNLDPVVLVEKLTNDDLASLGIEVPELSRSDKTVMEDSENHVLPSSKSSLKNQNKFASLKKTSKVKAPFMQSINIYVFDCGHACTVCNSYKAKKWLKACGYGTTLPSVAEAIGTRVTQSTNSLSPPAQDSQVPGFDMSGQGRCMTQPENNQEPHTHCSLDHETAVTGIVNGVDMSGQQHYSTQPENSLESHTHCSLDHETAVTGMDYGTAVTGIINGVDMSGQQHGSTQPENSQEPHTHCSLDHGTAVTGIVNGIDMSGQQYDLTTQPENSQEPHTHCSLDHGSAVSRISQARFPPGKYYIPILLPPACVPKVSNGAALYGSVPKAVLSPEVVNASIHLRLTPEVISASTHLRVTPEVVSASTPD